MKKKNINFITLVNNIKKEPSNPLVTADLIKFIRTEVVSYFYILKFRFSWDDQQDIFQELDIKLFKKITEESISDYFKFRGFLGIALKNTCINLYNRKYKDNKFLNYDAIIKNAHHSLAFNNVETNLTNIEKKELLFSSWKKAYDKLNDEEKKIYKAVKESLPYDNIRNELGYSQKHNAFKSKVNRTVKKFKKILVSELKKRKIMGNLSLDELEVINELIK